jgi:hypothetical protein
VSLALYANVKRVLSLFRYEQKGLRRWCMNICGNRIKVAVYQRRKRTAEKKMGEEDKIQ